MDTMASFFYDQLNSRNDVSLVLMGGKYLVRKEFLQDLNAKFQNKMEAKADEELKKPTIIVGFKSDRAVIADTQNAIYNQNIKQSKPKVKKVNQTQYQQQTENLVEISFLDKISLAQELKSMVKEIDEELLQLLVEHFLK